MYLHDHDPDIDYVTLSIMSIYRCSCPSVIDVKEKQNYLARKHSVVCTYAAYVWKGGRTLADFLPPRCLADVETAHSGASSNGWQSRQGFGSVQASVIGEKPAQVARECC